MAEISTMDLIAAALADPERAVMPLERIVSEEIRTFRASEQYREMEKAERYYRNRSAVQGKTVEVAKRSNTKIEHPIYKKLVDQKVRYLLSKPWSVDAEDGGYAEVLGELFDDEFRQKVKSLGKGAVESGIAWLQPYIDGAGKLCFMRVPSTELVPLWRDSERTELDAFIRFYDQEFYVGNQKRPSPTRSSGTAAVCGGSSTGRETGITRWTGSMERRAMIGRRPISMWGTRRTTGRGRPWCG